MIEERGFIAIQRDLFEHPLFAGDAFSRREAWIWLVAAAAYKPKGRRFRFGAVNLERGQLAVTIRELCDLWLWPIGAVHRYLAVLSAEAMIALDHGTQTGTHIGTQLKRKVTVITICNYDKFQVTSKNNPQDLERKLERNVEHKGEETPMFPMLDGNLTSKPKEQISRKEKDAGKGKRPTAAQSPMPGDGFVSERRKLRFCHYQSPSWRIYAANFRDVHGVEPMPVTYADGRGRWFKLYGETGNAAHLWRADRIEEAG